MHVSFRTSRLLATTLVVCAFTPVVAQEPRPMSRPDSIPIELATALIASGGLGGEPQILVGALPGWVQGRVYIPPTARILGAAFLGTTVVGVLSTTEAPDGVIATLKRENETRGWKAPPSPQTFGGGFRPATTVVFDPGTRFTYCGGQELLNVSATRRRGVYTEVVMRISAVGTNYSVCTPQPMAAGFVRQPFPTLINPANSGDARSMYTDCSGSSGSSGTGGNLKTTMSNADILDHYARQLQDSGWRASSATATVIGRSWTRTDSTGAPLELVLTVSTMPRDSTCRELNMQVKTRNRQ